MRKKQYQQQLHNQGQNEKKKKRVLSLFGLNSLGEQKKNEIILVVANDHSRLVVALMMNDYYHVMMWTLM